MSSPRQRGYHPALRKYLPWMHEHLGAIYTRNLHQWLLIAPIIGITVGLVITGIALIILRLLWPAILTCYLHHPWTIVPGVVLGFVITGLVMQYWTPDPDEHSTEEIIRAYHSHGHVEMQPFFSKLLAAITTVGFGGSAALEGPSIYGGGALGSWLCTQFRRFRGDALDRRIMLISGAAAGMAAVFRAPLTGLVFALEMPYKDDLAHEALLPSLIASVISYTTQALFLGTVPLFDFESKGSFSGIDLMWSAVLGAMVGLTAMMFSIAFRRIRRFVMEWRLQHWAKLAAGGLLTGLCGLIFVSVFKDSLIPLGPNYEAVGQILNRHHSSLELLVFAVMKLAATISSLAFGGVSAMFVPLFLAGGSLGSAFGQVAGHAASHELYAAVGMAAFIAAGYKTPLAAVTFIAETTGGHAFLIPTLIGAAVAYAVSGDTSVSGEQQLRAGIGVHELREIEVREIMRRPLKGIPASLTLREFVDSIPPADLHSSFPVLAGSRILGTISAWTLLRISPEKWSQTTVADAADRGVIRISPDCNLVEASRLLRGDSSFLVVTSADGEMEGVVTKADILGVLQGQQPASHK